MINLSISLAYVQSALKRQSGNRQSLIMQGLTFLFRYYEKRRASKQVEERQEAHYNVARTYHTVGLTHLALPYYSKVLEEVDENGEKGREDLIHDTAFNLQSLYAMSGNMDLAKIITDTWLVI
jgi:general transcription factor 3C polypeptide 3 (transcription factor C subunit 4)